MSSRLLNYRTFDKNYLLILFLQYKLGQLFNIYVNGKIVRVLTENESLYLPEDGDLHFVIISNKIRKRKLNNQGYWKQNGIESIVDLSTIPESVNVEHQLGATKRTFTNQDFKNSKLWEYSLYFYHNILGYRILLRHFLTDRPGVLHRYHQEDCNISIKAKENNHNFSKNFIEINCDDYILIETISNFVKKGSFELIEPFSLLYNNSEMNDYAVYQFFNQQQQQPYTFENYFNFNNSNRNINYSSNTGSRERSSKRLRKSSQSSNQIYNCY